MAARRAPRVGEVQGAWDRAETIPGRDPDHYRQDPYGNVIRYGSRGTGSDMAWDVDHRHPLAEGGTYCSRNLDAVQHGQNVAKGATYPYDAAPVGVRAAPVEADCRSAAVRSGDLRFTADGSVDRTCAAVRSGEIRLRSDGHIDGRSAAVRSDRVHMKK